MNGSNFQSYIAQHPIDVLKITPSHLRALMTTERKFILPRKYLMLGGEVLPGALVERIVRSECTCEIINHYGPTETTIGSLTFDVSGDDLQQWIPAAVPVGRPIANTQVYILDQHLQPLPVGIVGELYIGGVGLAQGYLHQPVQTAERFLPDPFAQRPGARMYKTGDLARYLLEGNVEIRGRIDQQVKIRGFRIELGEIEAVIRQHPAIREAVVLAREDESDNKYLVAYIVVSSQDTFTVEDVRSFVKEQLPEYMVPASFTVLPALPLTPNGKVAHDVLLTQATSRPARQATYAVPRNDLERTIRALWQEVLQIEEIGIHDNFFDLGGHSLLLVQLRSKLCDMLKRDVLIVDLFRYPTISSLAVVLGQEQGDSQSFQHAHDKAQNRKNAMHQRKQLRQRRG